MLNVFTWLWGTKYTRLHVDILRAQVERNLSIPHRFFVITDRPMDPTDIDQRELFRAVGNWRPPTYGCLRRWAMFSKRAQPIVGKRFLHIDLDTVITGSIDHLITDDPLKIWRCPSRGDTGYTFGPGLLLADAGVLDYEWRRVHGNIVHAMRKGHKAGWRGTDQAVLAPMLDERVGLATWTSEDGVWSFRDELEPIQGELPAGACMVGFYGPYDPLDMFNRVGRGQLRHYSLDWLREYYRC